MISTRAILFATGAIGTAVAALTPTAAQVSSASAASPGATTPATSLAPTARAPASSSHAAAALPDAQGANPFGEIIVTAQKRSERLSDVPMSITAASGEQLTQRGITSVADLQKVVPGLTFQPSDYGTPIYTIRGIGLKDIAVAVAPTVSVYVDQVPIPYSAETLGASLDLERVEVLKGPQGTLFGQNSTGGAINYIAAKPTASLSAGTELTYGRFNELDAQGYLSGPITDDIKARVSVRTEQRGNWQESETRDDGLGHRNFTVGRLLLDAAPTDRLKFELNVNGWVNKSDSQAAQFVRFAPATPAAAGGNTILFPALAVYQAAPKDARIADWDPDTRYRSNDSFFQSSLRGDYKLLEHLTLTSITAYSNFDQHAPIDADGTAVEDFNLILNTHVRSLSQELRMTGTSSAGRIRWMLGGNYADDRTSDDQNGSTKSSEVGVFGLTSSNFINSNHQHVETAAAFGSLDFDLTRKLTLQGSLRYTNSRNHFNGCVRGNDNTFAPAFGRAFGVSILPNGCVTIDDVKGTFQPGIVRETLDENNLSWRVSLNYKLAADSLLYANLTKGYKAGTFPTVAGVFASQDIPVRQESVLAYEVGFKASLFRHKAQLSGAAFFYDYKNKQQIGYILSPLFGPNPGEISIPKSRVYGLELNTLVHPFHGLTLNAGGTYVNSRVQDRYSSYDPFAVPIDLMGESFPDTPKWQYSLDVDYEKPMSETTNFRIGANYSHRSRTVAAFGGSGEFAIPAYGLLDLRAGLDIKRFRVQIWGHNVTNKFYLTTVTHVADTVNRVVGMPSTYGVTLGYKF
jgi:iron complex outermembrane receptor protein